MGIANISLNLFCLIALTIVKTQADSSACELKEKHLVALDLAEDSITKAKNLQPECESKNVSANSSECSAKEKVSAYLDYARKLIADAKENYSTCDVTRKVELLHKKPMDCLEIFENGENKSGKYTIWPRHRIVDGKQLTVYCDMETDGGGWTVIQRRGNFSKKVDFNRSWIDYKNGFGNISEEFWIGNDKILALTNLRNNMVRFDMESVEKEYKFATYSSFWIEDEISSYVAHIDKYNGTAGDGIKGINNMGFSTKDKRYEKSSSNCLTLKEGGWWYSDCGWSNPNGVNLPGGNKEIYMNWHPWTNYNSLLKIEIKIRSTN